MHKNLVIPKLKFTFTLILYRISLRFKQNFLIKIHANEYYI